MITVVYACNEDYKDCLGLSILSILRRTKETINFFVLSQDFIDINPKFKILTNKTESFFKQIVKDFNKKNDFNIINTSSLYDSYLKGNINESSKCSPYTNLRLLLDKTNLQGKIIYLDTDIMLNDNISLLYNLNLNNKAFLANRDWLGRYWHPDKKYINGGVLLMNLETIRQVGLFDLARNILFKRKYRLADQTALYKAAKKLNCYDLFPRGFDFNMQKGISQTTIVKHFCAGWVHPHGWKNIKQNNIQKVHDLLKIHNFDEDYKEWEKIKSKLF